MTSSAAPVAVARPPATPRRLRHMLCLDDFEIAARRHLPRPIFGYIAGAAETNRSLRENRLVFDEFGFVPRALANVSTRSQQTTLFGRAYASPFGIAPMGISALFAYRGDIALARAAATANVPMIMSGSSLIRLEDVVREGKTTWFQAYPRGDVSHIAALIERIARAGFEILVVTVDTQVGGNRENNIRAGFTTPLRPTARLAWDGVSHPRWLFGTLLRSLVRHGMPHFENNDATRGPPILSPTVEREYWERGNLTWQHFELIRRRWKGRLVLKGILDAGDARIARDAGADGIIVSNHGGRQLDGAVSPLRVLPDVVAACPDIPIMMDSGVRRGTDLLKALALGAKFVFIGRPFGFAAAIGAQEGVSHAIRVLSDEVDRDMALLGISSLAELIPQRVVRRYRWSMDNEQASHTVGGRLPTGALIHPTLPV